MITEFSSDESSLSPRAAASGERVRVRGEPSAHIDHDDLGIFDCSDGHNAFVLDRRTVAFAETHAIDFDRAARRHEIAPPPLGQAIFRGLAGFERRTQHPRIGPDRQRVGIAVETAGERHQMPGAVALRERPCVPARLVAGPFYGWSSDWQLIINTTSSVVTLVMVFMIQNTQRRDTQAIQLKLDELIRVDSEARNELISLEAKSETAVDEIRSAFDEIRETVEENEPPRGTR